MQTNQSEIQNEVKASNPLGAYLRSDEVLNYLPISRRTLERMKSRGLLPYVRVGARLILFKRADIDKALERLTVRPVSV